MPLRGYAPASMRLRPLLAAVAAPLAAALASAAPAAAAGDPIMPLSQVRSGMHCTGYSVVRGTAISSFDVEVLDVVDGDAERARPADPRAGVRAGGRRDRDRPGLLRLADLLPGRRRRGRATSARSRSRSASTAARPCSRRRSRRSSRNAPDAPRARAAAARAPTPGARSARAARAERACAASARASSAAADRLRLSARSPAGSRPQAARRAGPCSPRPPGRSGRSRRRRCGPGSAVGRRLLERRPAARRDRHRRLRRRRRACGRSGTRFEDAGAPLAVAAGRLRLPRHQQPARDRRPAARPTSSPPPGTTSARSPTTRSTPSSGRVGALPRVDPDPRPRPRRRHGRGATRST